MLDQPYVCFPVEFKPKLSFELSLQAHSNCRSRFVASIKRVENDPNFKSAKAQTIKLKDTKIIILQFTEQYRAMQHISAVFLHIVKHDEE